MLGSINVRGMSYPEAQQNFASLINALDNWLFVPTYDASNAMLLPINQRNIALNTAFTTAGAYFLDRWILVEGSATLTAAGLLLNGTIRQKRELALGTDDFTASVVCSNGEATAEYDDSLRYFDITSAGGMVMAAKLCRGKGAITAQEDAEGNWVLSDPLPEPGAEMIKSMRFYYHTSDNHIVGVTNAGTIVLIPIRTPVEMRATPAIESGPSALAIFEQGINQNLAFGKAVEVDSKTGCLVVLQVTFTSATVTQLTFYPVRVVSLSLSCEL